MKEVPPIKKLEEKQLKKVFTKRGWIITKTHKWNQNIVVCDRFFCGYLMRYLISVQDPWITKR